MYYDLETDAYPVSESEIRAQFANASFPRPFVPPSRWIVPQRVDQPAFGAETQYVLEGVPVRVGDEVTQVWEIVELTAEQIAEKQAAVVAEYEQALDSHLDVVAKSHRFPNGRHALALRAGYPNYWQDLGAAYGTWMDQCNVQAATLLQSVLSGQAQKPTLEAFIADLPVFEWPA